MCEYCEQCDCKNGIYVSERTDGKGFDISAYVYEKEKVLSILLGYNRNELDVSLNAAINYCPMYGRKL